MKPSIKEKLDSAKNDVKDSYVKKQEEMQEKKRKKKKQSLVASLAGIGVIVVIIGFASFMGANDEEKLAPSSDVETQETVVSSEQENNISNEEAEEITEPELGTEVNPLTVDNCPDLKYILNLVTDDTQDFIEFSEKYYGKIISFDGNIQYKEETSETYKHTYDLLIGYGDYIENEAYSGPSFITEYVTGSDFGESMTYMPADIGDNIKVLAIVRQYKNTSELFPLDPIKLELR